MLIIVLSAVCVLAFSFQSLFTKLYMDEYNNCDREMAEPVFSAVYGLFIAIASLCTGGGAFSPSFQTIVFGLMNGIVLLVYNYSIIKAGKLGSYSFMMIMNMFGGIIVPIIVGVLFLNETLSLMQIVAIMIMLVAMTIMNMEKGCMRGFDKGYLLWCIILFMANGLYGALMNTQATVRNGNERTEMLVILFAFSSLTAISKEIICGRGARMLSGLRMGRKSFVYLLICCVSATAGANLILFLFSKMDAGVICTINNGGVLILSFLYSFILFKEKPNHRQAFGMILAVISIVLVNIST